MILLLLAVAGLPARAAVRLLADRRRLRPRAARAPRIGHRGPRSLPGM